MSRYQDTPLRVRRAVFRARATGDAHDLFHANYALRMVRAAVDVLEQSLTKPLRIRGSFARSKRRCVGCEQVVEASARCTRLESACLLCSSCSAKITGGKRL
jgi:Zn finger protein HypA/HybF involved in hydrogenase expression